MSQSPECLVVDPGPGSNVRLSFSESSSLTLWSVCEASRETDREVKLAISPDRPVVIGRAEGHRVPYLDPAYQATRVLPGTGQSVLQSNGEDRDIYVSRGHFMLRADPDGVVLVNGVPSPEGLIRTPINGTWLYSPERRRLDPEEAYLIHHGHVAVFRLPNGAEIRIDAA